MKVNKAKAVTKKKQTPKENGGGYAGAREAFLALTPLRLSDFEDNILITDVAHRPYISKAAKEVECEYTTFAIGDGQMAVLKFTTKKVKKKV